MKSLLFALIGRREQFCAKGVGVQLSMILRIHVFRGGHYSPYRDLLSCALASNTLHVCADFMHTSYQRQLAFLAIHDENDARRKDDERAKAARGFVTILSGIQVVVCLNTTVHL